MTVEEIRKRYPELASESLRETIQQFLNDNRVRIAVIDDDPTGIQTVHDCPVLTTADDTTLERVLGGPSPLFFVLTNSRSGSESASMEAHRQIMESLQRVSHARGYHVYVVSRSDSTLRGHFPAEPAFIHSQLNRKENPAPIFFAPAFFEAGRVTLDDVQLVQQGQQFVPAAQTEYAHDSVFGYESNTLPEYIVEKSGGTVSTEEIVSLSNELLRPEAKVHLEKWLEKHKRATYVIVNATGYFELRNFAHAALSWAKRRGIQLVFRTSSSFVKAVSGIPDAPLLTGRQVRRGDGPGLIIVGSHVQATTRQLEHLLGDSGLEGVELDVSRVAEKAEREIERVLEELKAIAAAGKTPVVYTSRAEIRLQDREERLRLGHSVSEALVRIVRELPYAPSYVVSKGGITSHVILTDGLGIKEGTVLGQILAGVPVVAPAATAAPDRTGEHGTKGRSGGSDAYRQPPLVIFPGNVGGEYGLRELYMELSER